jgi:hypothetical protein
MILEVERLLPASPTPNFRERLVAYLEQGKQTPANETAGGELQQKAEALLAFYEKVFGVKDLLEKPDQSP